MKRVNAKRQGRLFAGRRDDGAQDFIRSLPCLFCIADQRAQTDPTEVEHVRSKGHGGYDCGDTVPGCAYHRELRHVVLGSKAFLAKYAHLHLEAVAKRLGESYIASRFPCP